MRVEQLDFVFAPHVDAYQYEVGGRCVPEWPPGAKVVDVVANEVTRPAVWLIEAKDFRIITNPPNPANVAGLAPTVEAKVRQSLASLPVVAGKGNSSASVHASKAVVIGQWKVVLHLEPYPRGGSHSHLFPAGFAAIVHQKLKQLVRDLDPAPLVLDIARTPASGVPWTIV